MEVVIKKLHRRNVKANDTDGIEKIDPTQNTNDDSNLLFPLLSKREKITPLVPRLTEMAGIKPILPNSLGMMNNLRGRSIPGYSTYGELTANRLLQNPNQMNPSIDFLSRLKRTRLL